MPSLCSSHFIPEHKEGLVITNQSSVYHHCAGEGPWIQGLSNLTGEGRQGI